MKIHRVYAVGMKILCVNLKGKPETIKLDAEKVIDDQSEFMLTAYNAAGEKIGSFSLSDVAGWWTEDRT